MKLIYRFRNFLKFSVCLLAHEAWLCFFFLRIFLKYSDEISPFSDQNVYEDRRSSMYKELEQQLNRVFPASKMESGESFAFLSRPPTRTCFWKCKWKCVVMTCRWNDVHLTEVSLHFAMLVHSQQLNLRTLLFPRPIVPHSDSTSSYGILYFFFCSNYEKIVRFQLKIQKISNFSTFRDNGQPSRQQGKFYRFLIK